jgi:hypothetical protein
LSPKRKRGRIFSSLALRAQCMLAPLTKLQDGLVFLAISAHHSKRSQFASGAFPARLPKGRKGASAPA